MKLFSPRYQRFAWLAILGLPFSVHLLAQSFGSPAYPPTTQPTSGNASSRTYSGSAGVPQGAFGGSVPEGQAKAEVLALSFKDAIDRGLRNNLGLLLSSYNTLTARSQRWKELSDLLPNLSAAVSENVAQQNLAASGIRFPGVPEIVGPYGFFDARAYLTQTVFSLKSLYRERGAVSNQKAAEYSYKDARDMVVLAVGNSYLQVLASAARVETAQAQAETAFALFNKAVDQQNAGVTPAIDTLRAQVESQTRQQQLIVVRNDLAKQKLALARVIGLPPGQQFTLSDQAPYEPLSALSVDESLRRAYASRADYQAALQQVQASKRFRQAASAERLPSLGVNANYGDLGITPGNSHGTFQVSGTLAIPIFQGGKTHADVLESEATLRQSQAQLEDLRGRIDYEVRSSLLDLAAAAEQVEVARSSVDLADQTLVQAKDRFAAGVADNLEVVQAQETVAAAHESFISSLYAHNLAKVELARALGYAEEGVKQYLKGK